MFQNLEYTLYNVNGEETEAKKNYLLKLLHR